MTAAPQGSAASPPDPGLPGKNAAPYFCPFCAEEDLHPLEQPGLWACRACLRTFSVTLFAGRS